jgi:hypothetical protein
VINAQASHKGSQILGVFVRDLLSQPTRLSQ